tara:strand:- start:65 stop:628 length:564 start_codon:yes stop_codon:yes gene_type:complete
MSFMDDLYSEKYLDLSVKLTPNQGTVTVPYTGPVVVYKDGYPVKFTQDGKTVSLDETGDVYVGMKYQSSIELPTVYVNKRSGQTQTNEWSGSLIIHRFKMQMGFHGAYKILIDRKGRDPYSVLYESTIQDGYEANESVAIEQVERVVPVYTRNTDMTFYITSDFPTPLTIYSMKWEGDYNPKYYKNV